MSIAQDRKDLDKKVVELSSENLELRNALTDCQRDFQRYKID